MERLTVSDSPFVRRTSDINKMFLYISMALVTTAIYGTIFFGLRSLIVVLISVASCMLFELIYNLLSYKKFFLNDLSSLVTGLLLALTMPSRVPYWIVVFAAFVSIVCVKLAFGGLGRNKFNPANVGRCFAGVVAGEMAVSLYTITLNDELTVSLTAGGSNSILNLLVGQAVGGIGTTCIIVILLCYVFLVYTSVIDFKIPLLAAITYFVVSLLLVGLDSAVLNLCSGSFLFVSVFMLPDPTTSPDTFIGKLIYSCGFGALCAVLWNMGVLGENTTFAVLLFVNLFVPMMDQYFVWKPITLGGYRNAHKN